MSTSRGTSPDYANPSIQCTYNLQSCVGSDVKQNVERTAKAILKLGSGTAPLQLCALQEIERPQFVRLQELTGMSHGAFHATREADQYGIGILSRMPIVEQSLLKFRKWTLRQDRACLFVKVAVDHAEEKRMSDKDLDAEDGFLWFASAHLQNDLTGLENGGQLEQIVTHLSKLVSPSSTRREPSHCVIGMDSNLPAFRMRGLTRQLGLRDATLLVESVLGSNTNSKVCYEHPSTFPSTAPSVKLDALLYRTAAAEQGGARVVVTTADAALSKTASLDETSGYHASDHRPVAGNVVF